MSEQAKSALEFAGGEYNKQALNTFNSLYTKAYNSGNLKLKETLINLRG